MKIQCAGLTLIIFTVSCCHSGNTTINYSSLNYDTSSIAIFNWDSALFKLVTYAEPLALTNEDLRLADSILIDAVHVFNRTKAIILYEGFGKSIALENFIINISKYKRQYYPYSDVNNQRLLYVICFSTRFANWKTEKYYSVRLHGGITEFSLIINLSNKNAEQFGCIGGWG